MNTRSNMFKVAVVGGEGIGPEVTAQSHRVLNWFVANRGVPITAREAQYGIVPYLATGKVLPEDTVETGGAGESGKVSGYEAGTPLARSSGQDADSAIATPAAANQGPRRFSQCVDSPSFSIQRRCPQLARTGRHAVVSSTPATQATAG